MNEIQKFSQQVRTLIDDLKSVCANCRTVLSKEGVKWKQGDLVADY